MNNNQFRKQEFEKRRVFKKATSLCNAYSCPIFQNCLLEIKQLQQENNQLKEQRKELRSWLEEQEKRAWDEVSSTFGYVLDKLNELEGGKND